MHWLKALTTLQTTGTPCVLVTIIQVRGHAPRQAGSKMVVTQQESYGSIGGGNLEASCIERARVLLTDSITTPETLRVTLNPKGGTHGVQCCGGEVTVLLEPLESMRETVAIFGAGHVGVALCGVLSNLPLNLYLIDSRKVQLAAPLPEGSATIQRFHREIPETALTELPTRAHLLIMTHDHAEDIAILDSALRRDDLGFIGLIGSEVKWQHFQQKLTEMGHSQKALARVTTPIGVPGITSKHPQAIAIASAAQLLQVLKLTESQL
jgi:xanthine dehydrogenase accessory factor